MQEKFDFNSYSTKNTPFNFWLVYISTREETVKVNEYVDS